MAEVFGDGGLNIASTSQVLGSLLLSYDSSGNAIAFAMSSSGDMNLLATSSQGALAALIPGSSQTHILKDLRVTGNVGIGENAGSRALQVNETDSGVEVARLQNSHASNPLGLNIDYSADNPNDTTHVFLLLQDSAATRATMRSNGGLANFQSNDVDLSDAEAKNLGALLDGEQSAASIRALEVRNFQYRDSTDPRQLIGVTAQQAAECEPGWRGTWHDHRRDGKGKVTVHERPGVHNKDIFFSHISATQHLMDRVDALEAELATLKG